MDQAWIDPRYAALLRHFQQQQEPAEVRPLALGPGQGPALRGFVLEPTRPE
ncbi:hypothetical protein ACFW1A_24335 [Kitasatospora sp. NPDC058965]|uniref:hypothetical protein n=1 Tax=Kitasatospora sp. NPDC058965 TaxID=3346682 RepID=UPI0036C4E75E